MTVQDRLLGRRASHRPAEETTIDGRRDAVRVGPAAVLAVAGRVLAVAGVFLTVSGAGWSGETLLLVGASLVATDALAG